MAYREVWSVQVQEVIRRWQAGESQRHIARATGLARNTVGKCIRMAAAAGISPSSQAPPNEEVLAGLLRKSQPGPSPGTVPAPLAALLEGQHEQIETWIKKEDLQLTRIHELLLREGLAVSYTTLRRFVRQIGLSKGARRTVRMPEWPPGEAAEMDFGRLGMIQDRTTGKRRVIWALVIVLLYSRHQFVWPLERQTLDEVIAGLEAAWRFFGGLPRRLIPDNFPAAVAGPDPLNPRLTRGFLEYSQARGLLVDPARPRQARDKPHVERGIIYVRERFFKGGSFVDLADVRAQAERWCRDVAGMRVHGTTRKLPLEVFLAEEQGLLQPYDGVVYDVPLWREAKVHVDYHISFAQAIYSVPEKTCPPGVKVEVRGDSNLVRIYRKGEMVKVHGRQPPGGRSTDPEDYPAEKTAYAMRAPDRIVREAKALGPNVVAFAERLFEGPLPWAKLRQGMKLIRFGEKYTAARLDAACARALAHDLVDVRRLERILVLALDKPQEPRHEPAQGPALVLLPSLPARFVRPPASFDHRQQRAKHAAISGQSCLPLELQAEAIEGVGS
jgi:transposase